MLYPDREAHIISAIEKTQASRLRYSFNGMLISDQTLVSNEAVHVNTKILIEAARIEPASKIAK